MPANRQHVPRFQREDEIIDVAVRLFTEIGFTATSMSAIARELGLAINAVVWYFPEKDDLLAAALHRPVDEALSSLGLTVDSPELWMKQCSKLDGFRSLITLFSATHSRRRLLPLIYTRSAYSQNVADFLDRHNALLEALVRVLLEQCGVGKGQQRDAESIAHQVLVAMMISRISDDDHTVAEHLYEVLGPVISLAGGVAPARPNRTRSSGRRPAGSWRESDVTRKDLGQLA